MLFQLLFRFIALVVLKLREHLHFVSIAGLLMALIGSLLSVVMVHHSSHIFSLCLCLIRKTVNEY